MTAIQNPKRNGHRTADVLPPHDVDAEEAVLASLMVDESAFDLVQEIVGPEHFFREQHGWIFAAARELWSRNEAINQVTVAHELSRKGELDKAGGIPFLSRIVGDLPTSIGVEHYAGIIRRDAIYRQMITAGSLVVQIAYRGGPNLKGALDEAERLMGELRQVEEGEASAFGKTLDAYWRQPAESASVVTNYPGVDHFGGFKKGELVIIAARPGMGKSAWMLNIAINASRWQKLAGIVFSLEMKQPEWVVRALARETGIDSKKLSGVSDDEEAQVMAATTALYDLPLTIDDRPIASLDTLRSRCRAQQRKGLDYVMIDYLQLITPTARRREQSRYEEITAISRGLKLLARELDVPVIAACQLNRQPEQRKNPRPLLSDLRDSGAIEQDADWVLFLHRWDEYFKAGASLKKIIGEELTVQAGAVEVRVAKHRNGPTGMATLMMDPATSRFSDPTEYEEPAPWAK